MGVIKMERLPGGKRAISMIAGVLIVAGVVLGLILILTGNIAPGVAIVFAGLGLGSLLFSVLNRSQLVIPLIALNLLIFLNIFRDIGFFSIGTLVNSLGNTVLTGNLIFIFHRATELVLLAIGMTLVTSASKGQDISVGATAAIAGSVFVRIVLANEFSLLYMVIAFLVACLVSLVFAAFNGTLVAVFRIQPMIASLILFTTGRSIAYWINGGATPTVNNHQWLDAFSRFIPGVPVHTPIITAVVCGIIIALVLKFTNLGLYTQAVGINQKSARLNGINPVRVKMVAFLIMGVCVTIAGVINVGRIGLINHETILRGIEMDAILAVAIGGNALSGGKFKLSGSVIGAYVITGLIETLYAMRVPSTDIQAIKAGVIIFLVVIGSPVVKALLGRLGGYIRGYVRSVRSTREAPAEGA